MSENVYDDAPQGRHRNLMIDGVGISMFKIIM